MLSRPTAIHQQDSYKRIEMTKTAVEEWAPTMATQSPSSYDGELRGSLGGELRKGRKGDILRLATMAVYGISIIGFVVWACLGERVSATERVLRTGASITVDQFYSGLALSAIFTPLAILIRNTSQRLARIHPFTVAKRKAIGVADLDRISDGGIFGAITMARYSIGKAIMQLGLLFVGATIMPIAALILTTGFYITTVPGSAVIGLPTGGSNFTGQVYLYIDLDSAYIPSFFQQGVSDLFTGQLLGSAGTLPSYDRVLSNIATTNIPLINDTWYSGILTYYWDAGCEPAPEIGYTTSVGDYTYNVTFIGPDLMPVRTQDAYELAIDVWMDDELVVTTNNLVPNGTTYYAIAGITSYLGGNVTSGDGLTVGPEIWVSRVKCRAQMNYTVSECQWNGERMTNCIDLPGGNTTVLDTKGLSNLTEVLNSMPAIMYLQDNYILGAQTIEIALAYNYNTSVDNPLYRGPRIEDYTNMYGGMAYSMVQEMSDGYYGTANVSTKGEVSNFVYLVRIPVLAVIVVMIFGCILFLLADLVDAYYNQSPIREMSFLTIATATRGEWWDECTDGLCAASQKEQRKRVKGEVTFGVDEDSVEHIGFAPRTTEIIWTNRYRGTTH